jgi:ABC-type transport system substrate-binding protein
VDGIEKISADLARIGIAVTPRLLEFGTLGSLVGSRERNFDAVLYGVSGMHYPMIARHFFHCSSINDRWQFSGVCDPNLDRLLDRLAATLDHRHAQPLWAEYQHRIADLQPFTFLTHSNALVAISTRLQGAVPDSRSWFVGVERWWISPAER